MEEARSGEILLPPRRTTFGPANSDGMDALAGQRKLRCLRLWILAVTASLIGSSEFAWARKDAPRNEIAQDPWALVNFTDEEPDFVPPPPRDEDDEPELVADESAEPLFSEPQVEPDQAFPPPDTVPLAAPTDPAPAQGDLLPPDRSHYDPGWNQGNYTENTLQVLPSGLLYRSYLAGEKESRISAAWMKNPQKETVWETTLGARVGLLRYGTVGAVRPTGWQLDIEGAALPRILPGEPSSPLIACDYRFGILSTWAVDRWHIKTGYYHLSSHAGDEFMISNPSYTRINYVRDAGIVGVTYDLTDTWQTYGEIAYAFNAEDGAKPLELQYGLQYSPLNSSLRGAPFAAINGHTRQDFDYITSVNMQAGWQWRGAQSQHLWRMGLQYYSGPALQYQFAGRYDHLFGFGIWFDF